MVRRTSFLIHYTLSKIESGLIQTSPTVTLVKGYLQFVITFFEVISVSAPHIYHSALLLSSRASTEHNLFKQCARPLVRVVQGLPISRGLTATAYDDGFYGDAAWSPCSRFVAVGKLGTVDILDATTLKRLNTFERPRDACAPRLGFSPNGRLLTQFDFGKLESWDFQTGGLVGSIPIAAYLSSVNVSFAHSADGNAVAVAYRDQGGDTIDTYDLLSSTRIRSRRFSEGPIIKPIWTHDERLRFATLKPGSVIIWEVTFFSTHSPVEVESLPAPDEITDGKSFLFLPRLSRVAFTLGDKILIWDAKTSKFLLNAGRSPGLGSISIGFRFNSSFSPDGRFFTCTTATQDIYVWKECPTGYVLHQKLSFLSEIEHTSPLFSPSGELIIGSIPSAIHIWSTKDQYLPTPSVSTRDSDRSNFLLGFSPGGTLAAFVRMMGDTVTVLDLRSGDPRLVIDAGMEVQCLEVTESAVAVAGEGKVVIWNVPTRDRATDTRVNIDNSVQVTIFNRSPPPREVHKLIYMSISHDLSRIATLWPIMEPTPMRIAVYDIPTGKRLAGNTATGWEPLKFSEDGREVWTGDGSSTEGWEIVKGGLLGVTKLKPLESTRCPLGLFSWQLSHGYEVAEDGWVLSPTKKRLLWLPHQWRLNTEVSRVWSGRFLGLGHRKLPEVVILEFLE